MKYRSKILSALLVIFLVFSSAGCGSSGRSVTVIDGDFAEMKIFTQIAKIMIEDRTDIKVKVQDSMASGLAFEQIKNGSMDIYMTYDGSLLTAYLGRDPEDVPSGYSVYEYADELGREEANVMLLGKLGHQNTYVLAVRKDTAEQYALNTVSDLIPVAGELAFAAEHEFFDEGSKHYDAFVNYYGLNFKNSNTIDRGLKYAAIAAGNMDVTIVYSTDGLNKKFELVTLEDDRHFFPEYNGAYLARADLYDDYPELEAVFAELAGKFNNEICAELNYEVDVENRDPYEVAYEFLTESGLIEKN